MKRLGDPSDFETFMKKYVTINPHLRALHALDIVERGMPLNAESVYSGFEIGAKIVWSLAMWAKDGLNVFKLTPNLATALSATDVSRQFLGMRLPYGGLVIDMSYANQKWAVVDGKPCSHIIVTNDIVEGSNFWRIWASNAEGVELHSFATDETIFDKNSLESLTTNIADGDEHTIQRACSMVAALTVWWHSSVREVESINKKMDRFIKAKRNGPRYWLLGKTVNIGNAVTAAIDSCDSSERAKLLQQHVVRGHFKQQPCGQNRTERKTVWVEPYWRGPDSETAWTHVYQAAKDA